MLHGGSYGRGPVADQVGREDVEACEAGLGEPPPAAAVARDAVQADHAWRRGIAPRVDVQRPAHAPPVERSEGVGHHLRAPSLLDERPDHEPVLVDQERAPDGRAVSLVEDAVGPRGGAVLPEIRRERVRRAELLLPCLAGCGRVAGDEDDLGLGVPEGLEVRLQVEGLLCADGRERPRVEDEQDVALAPESRSGARGAGRRPPRGRTPVPGHLSRSPSTLSSPLPEGT